MREGGREEVEEGAVRGMCEFSCSMHKYWTNIHIWLMFMQVHVTVTDQLVAGDENVERSTLLEQQFLKDRRT